MVEFAAAKGVVSEDSIRMSWQWLCAIACAQFSSAATNAAVEFGTGSHAETSEECSGFVKSAEDSVSSVAKVRMVS